MCASHNGEEIHVNTVKGMAKKLRLEVSDYECGCHAPYDIEARKKARLYGFTPFHNNCSGKHTGMLALAKQLGAETENYNSILLGLSISAGSSITLFETINIKPSFGMQFQYEIIQGEQEEVSGVIALPSITFSYMLNKSK